jgi:uncharacterized membrane protein
MSRKNAVWVRNSIIVLGIVLMAFVIECLGYNWHSIFHANEPVTFDLGQSNENITIENTELLVPLDKDKLAEIEVQKQNDKLLAEYNNVEYVEKVDENLIEQDGALCNKVYQKKFTINLGKEYYIKKLDMTYPNDSKLGYDITLINGESDKENTISDTIDLRLHESITNVNGKADKIILTINTSQEFTGKDAIVSISNQFNINYCRMLFLIGAMLAIAFVIIDKNIFKEHIAIAFVIFSLLFGGIMIVLDGTNQMSWDEQVHYDSAYRASFGTTIQYTEAALQMKGLVTPKFDTLEEKNLIADYLQARNDYTKADIKRQQRFIYYNVRAYLPQSIMLALARICNLPFSWAYMLGKFGNLLCYTLVMALAIRLSKIGKIYIAIIGLLPTPLFLATAYAYDAVITSFVFLGFILWLNEILHKDKKMKWYTALAMISCFVIGTWPKVIYIVMMLLLCFLPKAKFDSKIKSVLFRVGVIAVVGILLYTIRVSPIAATGSTHALQSNLALQGDKRVAGTNFNDQMQYVLTTPIIYTKLLLRSLKNSAFDYLLGTSSWLLYAYLKRFPQIFTALTSILILGASLIQTKEDRKYVLEAKWKVLLGIMAFGMASFVWTGLYLSYTSVGADYINGVQGRYYIPFILPLMFIFKNNKFKVNISTEMFHKIIFSILIFINLYGIYVYFLKPRCF